MDEIAIRIEHVSKEYRLGAIGGGTLRGDLQSLMARIKGREDPNSKIGSDSSKRMGERFLALDDVSFEVKKGEALGIIGHNGAGKSTTLKAVAGLVRPKSGEILLDGTNLVGKSTDQIVSSGVTLVPEGRRVFSNLTVAENLRIGAYLRKDSLADDLARVYDLFPRLKEREWQQAGTLSGGEQQMLAVGRALMAKPKLIMMDEPSLGLAPIVVRGIFEIIREINRQGITVLLIEQNANMALKVADWAYVMQTGSIFMRGPGAELAANEEVKAAYLGTAK